MTPGARKILALPKRPEWECALPGYLQHDLDAFKKGLETDDSLIDCLWGELYGSINGAEIDFPDLQRNFYTRYLTARRAKMFA